MILNVNFGNFDFDRVTEKTRFLSLALPISRLFCELSRQISSDRLLRKFENFEAKRRDSGDTIMWCGDHSNVNLWCKVYKFAFKEEISVLLFYNEAQSYSKTQLNKRRDNIQSERRAYSGSIANAALHRTETEKPITVSLERTLLRP